MESKWRAIESASFSGDQVTFPCSGRFTIQGAATALVWVLREQIQGSMRVCQVLRLLRRLHAERGITFLAVTHDAHLA